MALNYLVSAVKTAKDKLNLGESLLVLLICMSVIMGILIILMGILYGFKLFAVVENRQDKSAQATVEENVPVQLADDDEEIAAVIAAAVNFLGQDGKAGEEEGFSAPFKIKNIKRIK